MSQFDLYSDGGGKRGDVAASAFIIDSADKSIFDGKRVRVVLPLGGATNNEAEIMGGLVGLTLISQTTSSAKIEWYCDSEYTLKSATEYIKNWRINGWRTSARQAVKNMGLWRIYLDISDGLLISANHVKGHSGHLENEECDSICTQVQSLQLQNSQELNNKTVRAKDGHEWRLIDGRKLIESARQIEPDSKQFCSFIRQSFF